MKLEKLSHDPPALLDFFQEGLEKLGAVCARSWHDRLEMIAEGPAARLWNPDGQLVETEIHFSAPDDTAPREAAKEVFPGCPLTFHLAEALRESPLPLQRAILQPSDNGKAPSFEVGEKLWHAQMPGATRWKMDSPFRADWHFSLLVLARCEIQAIDQHWSLHRLAISLPDGSRDESLANNFHFCQLTAPPEEVIPWPRSEPAPWQQLLRSSLVEELELDLTAIRERQENYLRRELERVDDYFENYERELTTRSKRQQRGQTRMKSQERLAAARTEHERRRRDQVQRHEIRVIPHLDALLLVAEPAWRAAITTVHRNETKTQEAVLVPRSRRWKI